MAREASRQGAPVIEGRSDLLRVFEEGARPRERFLLGLEYELIGVKNTSGRAVSFDGEDGIEAILRRYAEQFGFAPTLDRGRVIGLASGPTAITLEPGGQLELSSRPHETLEGVAEELRIHLDRLREVSTPAGVSWIPLGLQPVTPLKEIPWVPKSRYGVMRPYYERKEGRALEMMALTASIQGNLDYLDEADAGKKVHLGAALGPVVGAMLANSCVEEGVLNGYCSRRLSIWRETDPDRCGTPAFFTDGSFSFERYADYALDVPMYFTVRDGTYLDRTGLTFRQYLEGKGSGEKPTAADWELHLTTLFPDVRLKDHVEFRTADSNPPGTALALMAFWMGLCHDAQATEEIWERTRKISSVEIGSGTDSAATRGLAGSMGGEPLLVLARDAMGVAVGGVSRLDRVSGRGDLRYLDPLRELLERGRSPAEERRGSWSFRRPGRAKW